MGSPFDGEPPAATLDDVKVGDRSGGEPNGPRRGELATTEHAAAHSRRIQDIGEYVPVQVPLPIEMLFRDDVDTKEPNDRTLTPQVE